MQKETLKSAIEKYYLNGLTENTKIVVKDKSVVINFTPTEDRSLIGKITISDTDLTDAEIGVYNTTQLLKLLKIMDHTIKVTFNEEYEVFNKIILQDNKYDLEFYLADINMIGKVSKVKEPSVYDLNISLDSEITKKYTDAKKALGETKQFTIEVDSVIGNQVVITLGDKSSYANKVKFNIPLTPKDEQPLNDLHAIPFSANLFHEVLAANKEAEIGQLSLSREGLLKLYFKEKNIESIYYLVRLEE